ncbi:hypothetical protein FA95DRAFT_823869 [Auriscalpium vulgare]|uniref:Uncharacterized protein n=1 Tax=Auriscalpium vulgare TaxID=40419 RepID=A0ACB8RA33_9AGAM|nr:hypothetical protein FA95DRAFT_823869 [Auriscalpium vulgare]
MIMDAGSVESVTPRTRLRAAFKAIRSTFHWIAHTHRTTAPSDCSSQSPPGAAPTVPNTASRISRLPVELLNKIFLTTSTLSLGLTRTMRTRGPSWASITQVCPHWRDVAVNYPLLWTNVTANLSSDWAGLMLKRSSFLPLRMHLRVGNLPAPRSSPPRILPSDALFLLSDTSRIQYLRLSGERSDVVLLFRALGPMPALEVLRLDVTPGRPIALPANTFKRDAPRLKRLNIPLVSALSTPAWLLNGISHFTSTFSDELTPTGILDVLQRMPRLESLTLRSYVSSEHWQRLRARRDLMFVDLKHLALLEVEQPSGGLGLFAFLSRYVRVPSSVRVRLGISTSYLPLTATSWGPWMEHVAALKPVLAKLSGGRESFDRVYISGGPRDGDLYAWTTPVHSTHVEVEEGLPPDDAPIVFHFRWSCEHLRDSPEFRSPAFIDLPALCARLPFAEVHTVFIGGDPHCIPVPAGCWGDLLSNFPGVKILCLAGAVPFLQPLPGVRAGSRRWPALPVLPKLERLVLRKIQVRARSRVMRQLRAACAAVWPSSITHRMLMLLLRGWATTTSTPVDLVLDNCDVDAKTLRAVRRLYGDVKIVGQWSDNPVDSASGNIGGAVLGSSGSGDPESTRWTLLVR